MGTGDWGARDVDWGRRAGLGPGTRREGLGTAAGGPGFTNVLLSEPESCQSQSPLLSNALSAGEPAPGLN